MEVIIRPTPERAARLTARLIANALRTKPGLVLGLATGRTMEQVYDELTALHCAEGLDFSHCTTFNLDEYIGLAKDHPFSYHEYMRRQLFKRVNIDPARTHLPDGVAPDLDAECAHYEELIRLAGGIDVQLLGIGIDGHIGFNEPLSALRSRTRQKALTPATIAQNVALCGGDPEAMPRRALTMGVGTILEARECLMLVTGEDKAEILSRAVEGPITAMVTGSALQLHPRCRVIVDEAAASLLAGQEYYRWIFANELEWAAYRGNSET